MSDGDESVLRRWARRKQAARLRQDATAEPNSSAPTNVQEAVSTASDLCDASVLKEPVPSAGLPNDGRHGGNPPATDSGARVEDLPDIESLTFDSDFTVFLQKGVPEAIKRLALRKLWTSNPVLANLDGLNDYDHRTMKFLEQSESAAAPVAEIGRGLHDKIMEAKRTSDNLRRSTRPRAGQRRPPERLAPPARTVAEADPDRPEPAPAKKPDPA